MQRNSIGYGPMMHLLEWQRQPDLGDRSRTRDCVGLGPDQVLLRTFLRES